MSQYEATTTWLDSAVFAIFLLSAVTCLLFSAGYHTFDAHSKSVSDKKHIKTLKVLLTEVLRFQLNVTHWIILVL